MDKKQSIPVTAEQFTEALVNTGRADAHKKAQKGFLCMFSGGLDSAGMLHALLTNPAYAKFNIYVHHCQLHNREGRHPAELQAVRSIIQYYHDRKDIRQFDYKETVYDATSMTPQWSPRFSMDLDVLSFIASQVCLARPDIKYVGIGVTKDEKEQGGHQHHVRITSAPKIFEAALYGYPFPQNPPQILYPVQELYKQQLWNSLPKEVQELCWSCRTPTWKDGAPVRCGKCETCVLHNQRNVPV
jgi:7-cyano-7-deazaguanine synthase in queuosine biosynthesis